MESHMTHHVWAFDSGRYRIEQLIEPLRPEYEIHIVKDPLDLPEDEKIDGIIIDPELGKHYYRAIADFAIPRMIPLFAWAPIGGTSSNNIASLHSVTLLPVPFDPEDILKRLNDVIDTFGKRMLLIASLDEALADSVELSLRQKGWCTKRATNPNTIHRILSENRIEAIFCDLNLADNIRQNKFLEAKKPIIIAAPLDSVSPTIVHLDDMIVLVSTSLDYHNIVEVIENTIAGSRNAAILEAAQIKALKEADLNEKKVSRLTQLIIDSAQDATSGRRNEELNLLNTQTDGLITELFDVFNDIISQSKTFIRPSGSMQLTEAHFLLEERVAHAGEIFDALRSVKWFKRSGPIEPVDLGKTISHAATKVRANRRRKNIEWNIDLSSAGIALGSSNELEECFINLLTNAYEATEDRGRIEIKSHNDPSENVITITDNGSGMGKDILHNATKPYFTTKSATHAGLGLTIAMGIIEYHNGEQTIESVPGGGTKVTIRLPMAAEKSDSVQFSRNPDILVVAHKSTLGFLEAGLVKFGWRIETAENIGEAIQMTKKLKPRMILVLAALGYMDTDGLRMLAESKGDARLVLLDPTESLPKGIAGLDSTIRGSFPLHHLLAIVNSYVQT